jgi:hypothetical protein
MDQFYSYNPAIGKDFSNLWTGYQYCVEDPSYVDIVDGDDVDGGERNPTSSSSLSLLSSSTSIGLSPSAPTQKGQPSDCIKRYTAQAGDSCSSVAKDAFITLDQFYSWNPTVSKDCSSGFWGGMCMQSPRGTPYREMLIEHSSRLRILYRHARYSFCDTLRHHRESNID